MVEKTKLILVDDNKTFLEGLVSLLDRRDDLEIIGQYHSGTALLEDSDYGVADLLLMDIEMPGLNGIETAKRVNYFYPYIKTIAITMYQDKIYLQQLIEAGFKGFVNKTMAGETLFQVIDDVLANRFSFPGNMGLNG